MTSLHLAAHYNSFSYETEYLKLLIREYPKALTIEAHSMGAALHSFLMVGEMPPPLTHVATATKKAAQNSAEAAE